MPSGAVLKIGDLVRCPPENRLGIIVDWYVVYNRFGDAVDKLAVVYWDSSKYPENEYQDMLEVINESR